MSWLFLRHLFFVFLALGLAQNGYSEEKWQYSFFPIKKFIFPALVADPWETQCLISFLNNYKQYGKIGTRIPVYKATLSVDPNLKPEVIQTGIDLLVYESMRYRKEEGGGFDLDTADTKFGFHLEYDNKENLFWRFALTHISAHLADGQYVPITKREKVHYSREFFQLNVGKKFRYLSPYLGFHNIFSLRHPKEYEGKNFFIFQWGGEAFYPLNKTVSLFAASDFQTREEFNYFINQSYVAGLKLQGTNAEPFRLIFQYFSGYDPRGEFYNEKVHIRGFGIQSFF